MDIFSVLFYEPIYNLIIIFYRSFGDNLGLAIIGIALFARILLFPFTTKQIAMAEKSQEFNEKAKQIKKKYKNKKEKQQAELMKLQSEYLPGQLAGCLPLILQLIIFLQIYRVISNLIEKGTSGFNEVAYNFVPKFAESETINNLFLGLNLKESLSNLSFFDTSTLPYILAVVLVGVSQYMSMKILSGLKNKRTDDKPEMKEKSKKDNSKNKNKKGNEPEDFSEIIQQSTKQAMLLMPIMITFFAYSLPVGLSIYWTVQSGFVIIQQFVLHKFFYNSKKLDKKTESN